jgi:outer membrane lipoprotein-sorting protein
MRMKELNNRCRPIPLPLQYSAEIVRSDGDKSKIYTDGRKSSTEQTVSGMTTISIWRPDLGKMYGIEVDTKIYTTHSITPEMEAIAAVDIEDDIEWEYVATELFSSHTVDIYDVFGKGESHRRARIYVDKETHIRWKTVTFNQFGKEVLTIETKNVEIGPPPASVFELPSGLQEFRIPKHDKA